MCRSVVLLAVVLVVPAWSAESVTVDPAKAAQLKRLEPLTAAKIAVFVEAGQLTPMQAALVKKHLSADGKLNLPASAIAPEPPRPPPGPAAAASSVLEGQSAAERDRLVRLIQSYRQGDRPEIGRELRQHRPAVNKLIAQAYTDPVDLPVKIALWEEVAGPANPEATAQLFETHRTAYELARPVLIPYAPDAGGIIVRRKKTTDGSAFPTQRFFPSRELREMLIEIEGLIAHCAGIGAATFLMETYAQRYHDGEAPMRDKGRDRHRLVEACGGEPKKFDQDEPETWGSRLGARERAAIAERLMPYLHKSDSDRRQIARNGLMICLGVSHPDWEAGRDEWERWFKTHRQDLR